MTTYYFVADAPKQPYGYLYDSAGVPTPDSLRDMERGLNCLARAWTFTRELTDDEKDKLIYGATKTEFVGLVVWLPRDKLPEDMQ